MASRRAKPGRNGNLRRGVGKRLRRLPPLDESQPRQQSATAVAAEAWRTGVLPAFSRRRESIPHEDALMLVGDPDDDSLANEYVGEDLPGGSTPTPDQSNVDEIGRRAGRSRIPRHGSGPEARARAGDRGGARGGRAPALRPAPSRGPSRRG